MSLTKYLRESQERKHVGTTSESWMPVNGEGQWRKSIKPMREVYEERRVWFAFYMVKSHNMDTSNMLKETNVVTKEAVAVMNEVEKTKRFDGEKKQHNIGIRNAGFGMETNMEESKGRDETGCNKDKIWAQQEKRVTNWDMQATKRLILRYANNKEINGIYDWSKQKDEKQQ